ncbi:hypothetical protein LCGC14_2911720 [marine sediment metagenome]|uniref:Uncharacterized protein n=1 Tax=marine sediment metagenome TaxID=412755 RepID=A0A0F8XRG0_9ZZZZ
MTIQETIRMIVAENSGGIKFTNLVSQVVYKDIGIDPVEILSAIKSMPDLEVLEYSWKMTKGHYREKIFVYTPMP